jgi:uncharacterized Tic20 family protein
MSTNSQANMWAMAIHLSLFAGYFVVPVAGLIAPILIWQLKKGEFPELDAHGREVVNFIISMFIYSLICGVLTLVAVGILGFMVLAVVGIVYPIIGGIKASNGEFWRYPFILRLV